MRHRGLTLIEALFCLVIFLLLAGVLMPSLHAARGSADNAVCSVQLAHIGRGLMSYASSNRNVLPPFAFSDFDQDMGVSSHWGGASQPADPAAFGRMGVNCVNLWCLVRENYFRPSSLICPAASTDLRFGRSSYFPYSPRFSSYSIRFPASEDLFRLSPDLANMNDTLLGVYAMKGGGQSVRVGTMKQVVPQVRLDWKYRLEPDENGERYYDVASDAMVADNFWRRQYALNPEFQLGLQSYSVSWQQLHQDSFNVLYGSGAVMLVQDDGTVARNSNSPGSAVAPDQSGRAVESIWQYFDRR